MSVISLSVEAVNLLNLTSKRQSLIIQRVIGYERCLDFSGRAVGFRRFT